MLETVYQARLIKKLRVMFPGCVILKNDSSYMQGVPDLIVLYGEHWAMLEVKAATKSSNRPNQEYYVKQLNRMSFAAFISPENEQEVLLALQLALQPDRDPCLS